MASGAKSKIVVFGEWGPFTYGAPAKILQVPEEEKIVQSSTTPSQLANLGPAMTKAKPFNQKSQRQIQLERANQEEKGQVDEYLKTSAPKTNKTVAANQPKIKSHLTQRLAPDDCREALARWLSTQRFKNKKVPQECHITGIVSFQTIEVNFLQICV